MPESTPVSHRKGNTRFAVTPLELFGCLAAPIALPGLAILAQYTGCDVWLSSLFYDQASGTWPLREHWLTQSVLHDGAQLTVKLLGFGLLSTILFKSISNKKGRFPKNWVALFIAMVTGPALIGYLKTVTHLASPWNELQFGGVSPHLRLFDEVSSDTPIGHAFPSAHASSGYAFVALYFTSMVVAPSRRFQALIFGLLLGTVFGAAQQARGAHFLSHDLFALSLCWALSGITYGVFYPEKWLTFFTSYYPRLQMKSNRAEQASLA